jgi:hypothetical protein
LKGRLPILRVTFVTITHPPTAAGSEQYRVTVSDSAVMD